MADFNFVNERLATGAAIQSPDDVAALVAAGVTHVVDCTDAGDDTPLFVAVPTVHVLWNPTADDGQHKDVSWFKTSLDFALPPLSLPGAIVYAHCSAGVNRGPSTCYAIMRALGFKAADAEAVIRAARPQVELLYKGDADAAVVALGYVKE